MSKTWTEMKAAVEAQASHDPQRAKLSERAWQGVEEGLRHLTGVGYNFEICPRGTMVELVELRQPQGSLPLSIADGQRLVAKPPNAQTAQFDAMVKNRTN